MDIPSALASLVIPLNVIILGAIYMSVALKERITGGGGGSGEVTTSRGELEKRSAEYPYTMLRMYDLVLLWNNFSAWNISHAELQSFFDANVSTSHLDVGVGSGYYPSHSSTLRKLCKQGTATLQLWDLNAPPLKYASTRIRKACGNGLVITTRQVNLLDKELHQKTGTSLQFKTASMNYVFHCVVYPQLEGKEAAGAASNNEEQAIEKFYRGFKQVQAVMEKGGIISGTTILTTDDPAIPSDYSRFRLALARDRLHFLQNKAAHFFNQYDTMNAIEQGAERAGLKKKTTFIVGLVGHFVFEV